MYIELYGLPGSGKSTLTRLLKEKSSAYISAREVSIVHAFFFILQHPVIATYWLRQAVSESFLIGKPRLLRFKLSLLAHTFAQVRYAQQSRARVILDEGFLQRVLSIFETKKTRTELVRLLWYILPADVYIEVVGKEPLFLRYHRPNSDRAKFGEAYLTNWEAVVRHNYTILRQVLKDQKVLCLTYVRTRNTVEEIDVHLINSPLEGTLSLRGSNIMHTPQRERTIVVGINDFFVGGGQRLVVDILKQPVFEGDSVHLITFIHDEKREEFLKELPSYVTHHRIDFPHILNIGGWWRLYRLLIKIKPDLVWTHFYFSNTVFRILKLFIHYRVVIVEHNTYIWKSWFHRVIDRILSRLTYRIVAVSKTVADFTSNQERIPLGKFVVIPNGVDLRRLTLETEGLTREGAKRALGLPVDQQYVINVARLSSQKNHRLLIEAFALFIKEHPQYTLLIVGDGPEQDDLIELIKQRGLTERVRFLGSRMDVGRLYRASDFFVLTSKIEGFALVCIEAMSFGLPVISTQVAGPDEYIIEGENGYLAASNPESVAEKMMFFATLDEGTQSEMRKIAQDTAQKYDIENTARAYSTLFSSTRAK